MGILRWTGRAGHARKLARTIRDVDAVVAVGGDGTIQEVAAGLLDRGMPVPMGIVPYGSGNDLARSLGLPRRPVEIVDMLMRMQEHRIDYGAATWHSNDRQGSGIFVNALGCGFDGLVASEVARSGIRGKARYLPAIFRSLSKWASAAATIQIMSDRGLVVWENELLLCTAANGRTTGGGILLTPEAMLDDGRFDICIARTMPLGRIVRLLPAAMRGRHLDLPEVTYLKAPELRLTTSGPMNLHLDGEVASTNVTQLEVRIVPKGLRVLMAQRRTKGDNTSSR